MARKTVALQKRQKKKKKISSSTSLTASKVTSKEKKKDQEDSINQEINIDSRLNEGQHITTHQNGEECDCFLRRSNMFLPANLLPENSSSTSNSSKR